MKKNKEKQINKVRRVRYSIDETELKYYMDLNYLKNSTRDNFNPILIEKFKNSITIYDINNDIINDNIFYDDDEF